MLYAILAYLLWGAFPAFFPLLEPASPMEILAHRIIWTAVFLAGLITVTRKWPELRKADRTQWLLIASAAVLIAANWGVYILAVNSGHVNEAALGYFINPLVAVALGVVFYSERLSFLQKISIGLAAGAVVLLMVLGGQPPVLGLVLAFTFGFYGLMKKRVLLSPIASLTAETFVLLPVALGYVLLTPSTFSSHGPGHAALMVSTGIVTAVPLLLFGKAAKLVPLSAIGMVQYLTPSMQMLWAVFVVHEHISHARWVGFCIIWTAVVIYLVDSSIRTPRRPQDASMGALSTTATDGSEAKDSR